ncbi:MAG TPA: SpoIIE family protein phosphatase [Burkholderiales bacterium]|nr:SpoIIE family protein phosphatase [Burkholderiales bacterium]
MSAAEQQTILAVDDTPTNISLLAGLLGEQYKVRAATNGAKALELAAANPPDLILLDIMMPGLSGYDVLERLRGDTRLRHIPVIMISAIDEIESVIRCIELGAEDYLPKPFNPTLLRTRVGASLEKKRLRDDIVRHLDQIENELRQAREIQLSMVPLDFQSPGGAHARLEVFATLEPAREIGGDLYDFFWSDDGRLYFVVADVSGKGAPAALFMARIKTMIRLVATLYREPTGTPVEPGRIVRKINEDVCADNRQDMFVTVFFGILDPQSGVLTYCNAGHNTPYVISGGGAMRLQGAHGIPLGIEGAFDYHTETRQLARGDCIFVYTDGVTEAMDGESSFYSDKRLEDVLRPLAGAPARAVVSEVIASVRDFAAGAPQADDIAAMAIRLLDE